MTATSLHHIGFHLPDPGTIALVVLLAAAGAAVYWFARAQAGRRA